MLNLGPHTLGRGRINKIVKEERSINFDLDDDDVDDDGGFTGTLRLPTFTLNVKYVLL